jgi:bis(5'-nucleosyl)-tetraphosphatase (symmetrical)
MVACASSTDLLKLIRFDPGRDELWSCGDLVNTGPESAQALRLARTPAVARHRQSRHLRDPRARGPHRAEEGQARGAVRAGRATISSTCSAKRLRSISFAAMAAGPRRRPSSMRASTRSGAASRRSRDARREGARLDWFKTPSCRSHARPLLRPRGESGEVRRQAGRRAASVPSWDTFYKGTSSSSRALGDARLLTGTSGRGSRLACVYGGRLTAWCCEEDRVESVPCGSWWGTRLGPRGTMGPCRGRCPSRSWRLRCFRLAPQIILPGRITDGFT